MPSPLTYTRVLAVPRSTAISFAGKKDPKLKGGSFMSRRNIYRTVRAVKAVKAVRSHAGAPEAARRPAGGRQLGHLLERHLLHPRHDHLRDPHAPRDREWLRPQIDQRHHELSAIVAVNRGGGVGQGNPVPDGEPRAGAELALVPLGNRDGDPGAEKPSLAGTEGAVFSAGKIVAGRARGGPARQRETLAVVKPRDPHRHRGLRRRWQRPPAAA